MGCERSRDSKGIIMTTENPKAPGPDPNLDEWTAQLCQAIEEEAIPRAPLGASCAKPEPVVAEHAG